MRVCDSSGFAFAAQVGNSTAFPMTVITRLVRVTHDRDFR
jgi:hypothetical protein